MGGLNDADRQENGVVSIIARVASELLADDVSAPQVTTSASSGRGGGRLSLYVILMLMLITGIRQMGVRRRRF